MLTSFTSGRSTGLVFEISASGASAVPVYEGFVVGSAVKRNSLGGNFLTAQYLKVLTAANIQLVPNQFIASKVTSITAHALSLCPHPTDAYQKVVSEGEQPKIVLKTGQPQLSTSFGKFLNDELVRDFQTTMTRIYERDFDEAFVVFALFYFSYECLDGRAIMNIPTSHYEFSTGYNNSYSVERCVWSSIA